MKKNSVPLKEVFTRGHRSMRRALANCKTNRSSDKTHDAQRNAAINRRCCKKTLRRSGFLDSRNRRSTLQRSLAGHRTGPKTRFVDSESRFLATKKFFAIIGFAAHWRSPEAALRE